MNSEEELRELGRERLKQYFDAKLEQMKLDWRKEVGMNLRISKIYEDAILPTRKHYNDAGLDLYLYLPSNYIGKTITLEGTGIFVYQTGIRVAIPEGYVGLIWPKSRSDFSIGGGVIDSGYRGEILVKIIKSYYGQLVLHHGDAIAQLLIQPISIPNLLVQSHDEFDKDKTDRGETGGIVSQVEKNPI